MDPAWSRHALRLPGLEDRRCQQKKMGNVRSCMDFLGEFCKWTIFVGASDFVLFLGGTLHICCIMSKWIIYLFGPAIELTGNEMEIFPNKDAVLLINNLLRNGQFTNKMRWGVWWDCSSIKLSFIWPSTFRAEILASVLCSNQGMSDPSWWFNTQQYHF